LKAKAIFISKLKNNPPPQKINKQILSIKTLGATNRKKIKKIPF
jgi:hypothetical protein